MATSQPTALRRVREREIVLATRALFDERGMQDARIEEIAQSVGIARGLIYRQFASRDELYVATVITYLDELAERLEAADAAGGGPLERFRATSTAYAAYCQAYPAFLDCSLSLMHRPARELREVVSEGVWLALGQAMARCIGVVAEILREGAADGVFGVEDPDYTANVLWTQTLGVLHLARIRVGVRRAAPGVPGLFTVDPDDVVRTAVEASLALVGTPANVAP